ncbi:MAG: hypothetical protein IJ874_08825 [Ruminococcus sp.]|nr:hypothetical protein [Ruminococcus sp.]
MPQSTRDEYALKMSVSWFHPDSHEAAQYKNKTASYLIGPVTGAAGVYWTHSEGVCCILYACRISPGCGSL